MPNDGSYVGFSFIRLWLHTRIGPTAIEKITFRFLLVVRAGSTPSDVAQRALQELQNKNVAGVVLNLVEKGQGYGSHYYRDYGYVTDPNKVQ